MTRIPDKTELLDWLRDNPAATMRDVARAFGVKGAAKIDLKRLLSELEDDGAYTRRKRRDHGPKLPPVAIIEVDEPDSSGDLFARPASWDRDGPAPRIQIITRPGDPALGAGDRVLAKLLPVRAEDHAYQARPIRKLESRPAAILGIYRAGSDGGRIQPITRGEDMEWLVTRDESGGAKDGELVEGQRIATPRLGLPRARITARLGDPGAPRSVSLIAIHQHGIPDRFPDAVLAEAEAQDPAGPSGRTDLRHLPLLTIDPSDARDHDDAVCAIAHDDGSFTVWVAIADVAHHVRPGTALDREARLRGNSTYFPDRVVPMLPDRLSGDLCSLHHDVERAVLAVEMKLGADGQKQAHRFVRGLMRSRASLSYEQAQAAFEGVHDADTAPLAGPLADLYAAWRATLPARAQRQPLDLDLPERRIMLDDDGRVTSVAFKDRLDAHRLIEEFMVLANVAAAEELTRRRSPLLFRVHEEPAPEKLDALRDVAEASGYRLAKGQVLHTRHLNHLLDQARGGPFHELINMSTLRSMTQAYYAPENYGHFGLALSHYAHFTSPIRRYADLIVHRALISAHGWGEDGLSAQDIATLAETAVQISEAERRSMTAERDTSDRYLAAFLADRIGATFAGRIAGVARFGLFVKLDETGADGLVPIRSLGDEFFRHDADSQTLTGEKTGQVIGLGQRVQVKLVEAEPVTGGLLLELLDVDGAPMARARPRRGGPKKTAPGKAARAMSRRKRTRG